MNPPNAKFCINCGASLQASTLVKCPKCGSDIQPGAKFCPNCGEKLI
ncbi:zinc-ribbon domain-containing protein [Candidatus Bathyarchaeota archaeon]|nr:zinc-ribbon domain-containing protein [Candidatus Bathyarchaeota archaeon]